MQTANQPFADAEAMGIIAQESGHVGPIAPGKLPPRCAQPDGAPLFASIEGPVASASLGQVYRAVDHDGRRLAVKVQRPGAVRQVSLDFAVIASGFSALQASGWGNGDLIEIVDIVADGVFQELDYRNEAANAAAFERSLRFLGYVSVPKVVEELPLTRKLIVTQWVEGRHLDALGKAEGLAMTQMAVEAVTASLVLTGFVHADPHEVAPPRHRLGTPPFPSLTPHRHPLPLRGTSCSATTGACTSSTLG